MKGRPIAVDLDGTLFVDDSAWENLRFIILRNPTKVPALLIQAFFGRASLKDWLHREAGANRNPPAIRQELLARLLSEKKKGRAVHLVSGAPQDLVEATAKRLGFNLRLKHWGSSSQSNLTFAKKELLVKTFGVRGYDYYGDRKIDIPIFKNAERGAIVGARPAVVQRALRVNPRLETMAPKPAFASAAFRALRPHQWVKNLLLLVPLFSAHIWGEVENWILAGQAFVAFSLLSSAVYLLNDLYDLLDHNLIGTIQMLEFCKQHSAGFILMSTSRVYSIPPLASLPVESAQGAFRPKSFRPEIGLTEKGISEIFPTAPPASLYGTSKRCSELLALEYAEAFGFPVWINRCGVLAGTGQFGRADQGIFSFWIRSWKEKRPLKYIGFDGRGSQVRDCLHPRDLIPLLQKQLQGHKPFDPKDGIDVRICNFSGGTKNFCSLAQLSDWCRARFGPHEVTSDPHPRPYDLPWVIIDSTRASKLWNWHHKTSLETIFSEISDG